MSLVVLSNSQEEYAETDGSNTRTGIQQPADFSNHLVNPMKIPAHSEVAVQSVKINRSPLFDIKPDNLFHFYLGSALRTNADVPALSMENTGSIPIPITLTSGQYTIKEMAAELQRALRVGISHPTYWDKVVVRPHYNGTTNLWEGFKFTTDVITKNAGSNHAIQMATWVAGNPYTLASQYTIETTGTTKVITRNSVADRARLSAGSIVNTDCPQSLNSAGMVVNFFDNNVAGRHQSAKSVSLSRPDQDNTEKNWGTPQGGCKGFVNEYEPANGDYVLTWAPRDTDGKYALFLHAWVNDAVLGITSEMKEIEYWKQHPTGDNGITEPVTAQIDEDNIRTTAGTGYYGEFKWEVIGEGMKISMRHNVAAVIDPATPAVVSWKIIHDSTRATNRALPTYCMPPINQNKWALYVGAAIKDNGEYIIIKENYWDDELRTKKYSYDTSSWWSQCKYGSQSLDLARQIEFRDAQKETPTNITWVDKDASGYSPAYTQALVIGESRGTPSDIGEYAPSVGANMGDNLGFGNFSALQSGIRGITRQSAQQGDATQDNPAPRWEIEGWEAPNLPAHSLFIKCPSLTAESYNFAKSIPSQILYHLPRFTNAGKAYGNLFYEVSEKTYVSLNNTETLNVNQVAVQLCNKNERVAQDLTGDTIIVLHFRRQR